MKSGTGIAAPPGRIGCRARRFGILLACVLLAGLLLAGMSLGAHAQGTHIQGAHIQTGAPDMAIGDRVEKMLVIGGKQIPLPHGQWIVAGRTHAPYGGERVGAFGVIANLVLLRVREHAIDAALEINTNLLAVHDGWGVARDCRRTDLVLAMIRYMAGWDGSCFIVTHILAPRGQAAIEATPRVWRQAIALATREGWAMPGLWLTTGFRAANRSDIVDARLHFSPAAFGQTPDAPRRWRDSAWAADHIAADPARLAVGSMLKTWAALFSGYVEAGLKNRLTGEETIPMPQRVEAAAMAAPLAGGVIARRAAALAELQHDGTITEAEQQTQDTRLRERGLDPGSQVVDPATVALYKTLSYRPLVSLANVFIDLYWIGSPFAAGVLVFLQVTVNTTKFYFHELAWEKIRGSGQRRDSARTIDFAYYGIGD